MAISRPPADSPASARMSAAECQAFEQRLRADAEYQAAVATYAEADATILAAADAHGRGEISWETYGEAVAVWLAADETWRAALHAAGERAMEGSNEAEKS